MTNNEAKEICLEVSYHLQFSADRATAGYWDYGRAQYHLDELKEKFKIAGLILGFDVVPLPQPPEGG